MRTLIGFKIKDHESSRKRQTIGRRLRAEARRQDVAACVSLS
jgi:hypothetical protein